MSRLASNDSANRSIIRKQSVIASEGSATKQTGCRRIRDPDEELSANKSVRRGHRAIHGEAPRWARAQACLWNPDQLRFVTRKVTFRGANS